MTQAAGNLSLTQKQAGVKCHHALLVRMRKLLDERAHLVSMIQVCTPLISIVQIYDCLIHLQEERASASHLCCLEGPHIMHIHFCNLISMFALPSQHRLTLSRMQSKHSAGHKDVADQYMKVMSPIL